MYIVALETPNGQLDTLYGPFETLAEANQWVNRQDWLSRGERLVIRSLYPK